MIALTKAYLLDPIADLHWSVFRGAIQDIFSENAEAHPDRLCVVETASAAPPRREFTYRQINEASNILAHYLVQSGIRRGEVVMSYSHRGVDLVVTVMGILKAGATFSVIDLHIHRIDKISTWMWQDHEPWLLLTRQREKLGS